MCTGVPPVNSQQRHCVENTVPLGSVVEYRDELHYSLPRALQSVHIGIYTTVLVPVL
jgi:hypothetical protein